VAADGDVVRVQAGVYRGPLRVSKQVRLVGEGHPILDGGGRGTVVTLSARGAAIEGFVVRASGDSLDGSDAGIAVTGAGARVSGNRIVDVLFGVTVDDAASTVVTHNVVTGKALDIARRGDAIRVWHSSGTRVENNDAYDGRDVVLWYSDKLAVRGNRVTHSRYGLHFMFCDDADIESNLLADNSVGAFLMYSRRLRFVRNTVADNDGPSGYGLGLKDMDDFQVRGNRFVGNRVGVFLDDSPRELGGNSAMTGNLFAGGEVGVRFLPNVERLAIEGNSFVENQQQVEVAGSGGDPAANRWRGNHWSDYAGYDANGDGVGDVPYRAERLFEQVVDRRPALRFFLLSPATTAIDFAARAFPLFRPQAKLEDDAPRLAATLPTGTPALEPTRAARLSWPVGGALFTGGLLLLVPCVVRLRAKTHAHFDVEPRNRAMDTDRSLLQARGLCKRFGALQALDDVTFDLHAGEAVALWGANGAGKTTLLRALLGAIPFDGTVRLGGHDVRRQGRLARRLVGFVPQEIAFPELTAGEALELFAGLHGASQKRIDRLVERLDLGAELDKRVQTLSGGRKQRLALAIALVADPPLLLLDEPSSNLDVAARRELLGLLLELKIEGKALLFSSHRPEEVVRLADRVLHLEGGRLLADAPPAEVLAAELAEAETPNADAAAQLSHETSAKLLRFR
jgi:nitrous oxidase accessory protein/Cu-processing system ATP-binding protein